MTKAGLFGRRGAPEERCVNGDGERCRVVGA